MNEFDIIRDIFKPLSNGDDNARGFIDDVAIIPKSAKITVFNTDTIVEGTHFLPQNDYSDIGYKLAAVNISDIIAKGCLPIAGFLNLTLPNSINSNNLEQIAKGITAAKREYGDFSILGGDTTSINGNMVLSMSLIGEAIGDYVPNRGNAKIGDSVYVTGVIGDAKIGLELFQNNNATNSENEAIAHYNRPKLPNLKIAELVSKFANASMDISDGLLGDFDKVLKASSKGGRIYLDKIPFSQTAQKYIDAKNSIDTIMSLVTFGDDYQTLFTANASHHEEILELTKQYNLKLTKIGEINNSVGMEIIFNEQIIKYENNLSYSHNIGNN